MLSLLYRLRQTALVRNSRLLIPNQLVNYCYHFPLAVLSNVYFRFPSHKLKVIGVTGTDGKTTTTNLIYHLLKSLGKETAMVSTVNAAIGEKSYDTGFHVTSPHPWVVQRFLKEALDSGAEFFVMEVTSHALEQHRVWGIPFKVGVFTNITEDHLDYHRSQENYLRAKAKLAQKAGKVVLNACDPNSEKLIAKFQIQSSKLIRYGIETKANIEAWKIKLGIKGTNFWLEVAGQGYQVSSGLLGRFNVENVLAAIGVIKALDLPVAEAVSQISSFKAVSGRMNLIDQGQPFTVIIDFAHTANALKTVLEFLHQVKKEKNDLGGRLMVVFGCAGERDPGRRRMGEVAARLADLTVITAEDPRTEGVERISQEIGAWAKKGGAREIDLSERKGEEFGIQKGESVFTRIPDREEAIKAAIGLAQKGDIVLITGKGHERSMCFGTREVPWSDEEVVRKALEKKLK